MKKSLIWILTIVMSVALAALLYFQITYLESMIKMREAQFSENVMRAISSTSTYLERLETLHFLEQDAAIMDAGISEDLYGIEDETLKLDSLRNNTVGVSSGSNVFTDSKTPSIITESFQSPTQTVGERYRLLQEVIRSQFLYQKGLLNEVILTILRDSGSRPVIERADSALIGKRLRRELNANGLDVPFVFAVAASDGNIIYSTEGFSKTENNKTYSQLLFPNTDSRYRLLVEFPTKENYIFSSVRFVIPTLALTVLLLVVFIFTIILVFRQKKLSEMKTDFINNMTHELKTPISTISLAGQMLQDDSVRKSPATLQHLSNIIIDESKRLRFQVEKVLQMSVFDSSSSSALKFTEVDVNTIIPNVVSTFKIKVEKYGGSISTDLDAVNSLVNVDEMQFTNVIFNLLDNAVKYMRSEVSPDLRIHTLNVGKDIIEIRVSDNGLGIKKDDLKRIFEKFYRVPTGNVHDVKGFGLGLAYVKKMVSLFGGQISVESEFGKGTTFIIQLPVIGSDKS